MTEQIILPPDVTIESATFSILVDILPAATPQSVEIYLVTSDWAEGNCTPGSGVTWNTQPTYDNVLIGNLVIDGYGWKSLDVLGLVLDWYNGNRANYGILLKISTLDQFIGFHSSEMAGLGPKLILGLSDGTMLTVQRSIDWNVFDAYITEQYPDNNFGCQTSLGAGFLNAFEKQSLIRFELPIPPPPSGCTLTPGYWKTHSEFGPAPYDDTWAQLTNGAATVFFLSGKSYYEVLWTSPGGDAYYILAHAYIAAQLNVLNGTSIPAEVQTALNASTELFEEYTPSQVVAWKGNQGARQSFITLAGILDDYNNGINGPGHCY